MADLKFGSVTPALGKIKVGGDDVSKIYQGSDQVWPSDPGSYLVQVCGSTTQTRITAKEYWDASVVPAVLIDIPSIIADDTVLKISTAASLEKAICVQIINYDASIAAQNNYYFVSTPIYLNCTQCSPTPIGPSPGPEPTIPFLVRMCQNGEEFYVDPVDGYNGTTPVQVSSYQLSIGNTLLVKNTFNGTPKCATIISNTNLGSVSRYFDFINGAGINTGCPGDPGSASCID